jgi:hypothetical protein
VTCQRQHTCTSYLVAVKYIGFVATQKDVSEATSNRNDGSRRNWLPLDFAEGHDDVLKLIRRLMMLGESALLTTIDGVGFDE